MPGATLASFALVSLLLLPALPELFAKSKAQFQSGAYAEALKTLEALEIESQKPGLEKDRAALLPGLLFYRGASLAALGRREEAQETFEGFLAHQPNVQLDPARYPRAVLAAFENARRAVERRRGSPKEQSVLAAAYSAFPHPEVSAVETPNEDWVNGPVRSLLTPQEKREFESRYDPVSRAEFVTAFWKALDPRPETPENEYQSEFAKRVAFADLRFAQDETRGSLTDRGMVFILLGPPSYSGRKPLRTGEDVADASGLSQYGRGEIAGAQHSSGKKSSEPAAARVDRVSGPGSTIQDAASNWIEVWHYIRRDLPPEIPYQELEFQFITKLGYGKNVLQRESKPLSALERARAVAREGRAKNRSSS